VRTGEAVPVDVNNAPLDPVNDPAVGEKVTPKASVRLEVGVADPMRLLTELGGNADHGVIEQWLRTQTVEAVRRAASAVRRIVDLINPQKWPELAQAARAGLEPALGARGLWVASFVVNQITVPDEVGARLRLLASSQTQPGTASAPQPAKLAAGARVRMTHDGQWYSGTVTEVGDDGRAEVDWDRDGGKTRVVAASLSPEPAYPGSHVPGTPVIALAPDGAFRTATVRLFNGTSYQVAFESGVTAWLEPGQLRLP
jgi:hypothetical protein